MHGKPHFAWVNIVFDVTLNLRRAAPVVTSRRLVIDAQGDGIVIKVIIILD